MALSAPNVQSYFNAYSAGETFNFASVYTNAQIAPAGSAAGAVGITGIPASTPVFGIVGFTAPADAGGGTPQNTWNLLGRFDYSLSDKTQIFFRYVSYNEADEIGGAFASPYSQYNVGSTTQNQAYLLSASHVFNPSLVENTKLSFSRFNTTNTYDAALQNTPALAVSANAQVPNTSAFIQLSGFFDQNTAASGGLPFGGPQNTVLINQDLQATKGKHAMQFGTQIIYIQDNNAYGAYAQAAEVMGTSAPAGLQNFVSGDLFQFEAAVDPQGALPCVLDPYTGVYTQTAACSINTPATPPAFARSERFHDWAAYAQDFWKATPRPREPLSNPAFWSEAQGSLVVRPNRVGNQADRPSIVPGSVVSSRFRAHYAL